MTSAVIIDNGSIKLTDDEKRDADRLIDELLGIPHKTTVRIEITHVGESRKSKKRPEYYHDWYEKNKEATKIRSAQWKKDNPDKVKKMAHERYLKVKEKRKKERQQRELQALNNIHNNN